MIRIANGQGFWGDWLEAPVRLVEQGPIDYLALDYLAEITMSIVQKQKQADPKLGYARDFPPLIGRIAKQIKDREVKVVDFGVTKFVAKPGPTEATIITVLATEGNLMARRWRRLAPGR